MVELVDTLVSGTSAVKSMEVQVFFWAKDHSKNGFIFFCSNRIFLNLLLIANKPLLAEAEIKTLGKNHVIKEIESQYVRRGFKPVGNFLVFCRGLKVS